MAKRDHGPQIRDDGLYEELRKQGNSKEKAARIANARAAGTLDAVAPSHAFGPVRCIDGVGFVTRAGRSSHRRRQEQRRGRWSAGLRQLRHPTRNELVELVEEQLARSAGSP